MLSCCAARDTHFSAFIIFVDDGSLRGFVYLLLFSCLHSWTFESFVFCIGHFVVVNFTVLKLVVVVNFTVMLFRAEF